MSQELPHAYHQPSHSRIPARADRQLAKRERISINQLISTALAALMTEEYLAERAARGSEEKYRRVLGKVSDHQADYADELE